MDKYRVTVKEIWYQNYLVEANSAEEAKELVSQGGGEIEDDTMEYSHMDDDYEMECELVK